MKIAFAALVLLGVLTQSSVAQTTGPTRTHNPYTVHKKIGALGYASVSAATLVGSLAMNDEYFATTVIPVVGPFVTMIRVESDPNSSYEPGGKPLLIASGLLQTAFATYFVVSLVKESNYNGRLSVHPAANGTGMTMRYRL